MQFCTGTGKSETGAHIAYVFSLLNRQLNQRNRHESGKCVIYCGPSNKAVDVVLGKNLIFIKGKCTAKCKDSGRVEMCMY